MENADPAISKDLTLSLFHDSLDPSFPPINPTSPSALPLKSSLLAPLPPVKTGEVKHLQNLLSCWVADLPSTHPSRPMSDQLPLSLQHSPPPEHPSLSIPSTSPRFQLTDQAPSTLAPNPSQSPPSPHPDNIPRRLPSRKPSNPSRELLAPRVKQAWELWSVLFITSQSNR